MSQLLNPLALLGLLGGAVFAALCLVNIRWAALFFVWLGGIPTVLIEQGRNLYITQGLLLIEILSTALIIMWLVHQAGSGRGIIKTPFNLPLMLLIPAASVSLVFGFLQFDPNIEVSHLRPAISVGQVLLFAWPVGLYLVMANSFDSTVWIKRVWYSIVILGIPALAVPFLPDEANEFVGWTIYFSLAASPLCFAALFYTRSPLLRPCLLVLALAPLMIGLLAGRAFFLVYVVMAFATICVFKARRAVVMLAPLAIGIYLVFAVNQPGITPSWFEELIAVERQQQSIGGRAGRGALAMDAVAIWVHHPILGVGPGNNYPYMLRYSVLGTAHSQYFDLLLELGIIGMSCFLLFIVLALRNGIHAFRAVRDPFHQMVVLGWLGLFSGFVVGSMVGDFMLQSIRNGGLTTFSEFYLQWVVLGLVVAIQDIEARELEADYDEGLAA